MDPIRWVPCVSDMRGLGTVRVVNFGLLREFEELFIHRWDALALLCLAAGGSPLRFNQLAAVMNEHADERLSDGTLTRSLHRLTDEKLVEAMASDGGYNLYTLTTRGEEKAARLDRLLTVLIKDDSGADGCARAQSDG